uniref:Proteasome activator complex subunit 4A-like isoform X1 n=2 Tax=Hirondellea gigas TaxID=1518452 RepID=A0A6A7FWP5_9CRUS
MLESCSCNSVATDEAVYVVEVEEFLKDDHYSGMGDDMDDGVKPDICDEGGLGFTPQRRNVSNNLLPYANQLDAETASQLMAIKTNLVRAVALSDINHGVIYWTAKLYRYIKLNSYCFTKEDHIAFIKLLFEVVITFRDDIWVNVHVGQTLLLLLKKVSLLTPDDLELPWRPLYDLHQKLFHNAVTNHSMLKLPMGCENNINSLIRHCRPYFGPGTTEELLQQFLPMMCPFDEQMNRSMRYLDMFLPLVRRQGGRPPNHHLWRPLMLDMLRNSPFWEVIAVGLLSRLAWKNMGHIDWEDELPLFFTKVLRSFKLPVGYRGMAACLGRGFDNSNVAMFIVANLGGGSSTQQHLCRLVGVVESYLHPSNYGSWTSQIMDLFNKLTLHFNKRINRERRQNNEDDSYWENTIPDKKKLKRTDVDAFVDCLLPVTLTALFGRAGIGDASVVLARLAALRTTLVMTKFLDLMYPALTSSTEPIRLQACLSAGMLTARSLVTGGSDFPAGPTHVLPLLKLLLPGIDPNDISKTMSTFQLLTTFSTLIPLVDCSAAPSQMELSEEETELCMQSAEFCDFLLVFLERCLTVVESCVSSQSQTSQYTALDSSSSSHAAMSKEETLLEAGMSFTIRSIFQQSHPDIAKLLVRRLSDYVIGRTLETGVSGRLLANICRAAAKAQPAAMLAALVPPTCRLLVSLTASEAAQKEERPDSEVMFNLLMLSEVLHCRCDVVVLYVDEVSVVLQQCLTLVCVPTQQLAVSVLGALLDSLTTTEPVDCRSFTQPWDTPFDEFLPVRHWGALIAGGWTNMKIEWVEPGPDEQAAVTKLFHTFILPELDKLDKATQDLTILTREQLKQSVSIVLESFNAGALLPYWDEEPIELLPMQVPIDTDKLILSSCPYPVQFSQDTGRPSNVRKAVAETILRLSDAMITTDSDNTKVYNHIINILWTVGLLHSIKRSDFDSRWRTLSQVQRLLRSNLVGPHQHWHYVRHVMTQRANLQHLSRTLEHVEGLPFTATHKAIIHQAFRLSTTNYSPVRRCGQQLLRNLFVQFPGSYLLVLPAIKSNLALDPTQHHKKFKGTLHVLLGSKCKCLLLKKMWPGLQHLWPALLTAQHSEKPSIATLISQLTDNVLRYTEILAFSDTASAALLILARSVAEQLGVSVESSEVAAGQARVEKEEANNLQTYHQLLQDIATQVNSGKLQWRYELLGIGMLGSLIRMKVPFPACAVKCITAALIHHNNSIRRLGVYYLSNILRNQKRAHVKLPFDPYAETGGAPVTLQDRIKPGVDRPDNAWLQYDPSCVDMTEQRYNERKFIHSTYMGFTSWPSKVELYAPPSEQPPLNRSFEELSDAEKEIYLFFSCTENVQKWIDFLTLEDQRGSTERFDARKMMVFKGLFRNFGNTFLGVLKPHLERMVNDAAEAGQRCAAEIIAGLTRATKHWMYSDWKEAMSLVTSLITQAFPKMTSSAMDNWHRGISKIIMDRDANLLAPLVEMLIDFPDLPTTSSFTLQCRLYLCTAMLQQQEWRMMGVLQRVLERLTPALSHPYKTVRDRISLMLFNVFCDGTNLYYGGRSGISITGESPDLGKFVEYVLGELGSLQEYSGGNSSGSSKTSNNSSSVDLSPHTAAQSLRHVLEHMVPGVEAMVTAHEISREKKEQDCDDYTADGSTTATADTLAASLDEPRAEEDSSSADVMMEEDRSSQEVASSVFGSSNNGEQVAVVAAAQLPSPSFEGAIAENDERKNAFRIINTICSFIQIICARNHYATPKPIYKLLGALCQLESVDSEQEVCRNCVGALCTVGQTLVRQEEIPELLHRIRDITHYRWWRARISALGVLQMVVFHNALTMMACKEAPPLILEMVLDTLTDERLEVRTMAQQVLASLLHIAFVQNPEEIKNKFSKVLRKKLRGSWSSKSESWSSERMVTVHGAVLGLTSFVESAPYTIPSYMPQVLCTLANYINLPQPIAGSIRDSLSHFRRTHHDNWQEHKQHFSPDQLDVLNDLLLSPSYYA